MQKSIGHEPKGVGYRSSLASLQSIRAEYALSNSQNILFLLKRICFIYKQSGPIARLSAIILTKKGFHEKSKFEHQ